MNFVWFIIAQILWGLLFWYFIGMIISLPSMPFILLMGYASENIEKKWAKILLPIAVFFGFIFGTLLLCLIFGGGVGLIASNFSEKATYPLVYLIIGGFMAFTISAPSGETNCLAMALSLLSYILTVNMKNIANMMGITVAILYNLVWIVLIIFILSMIIGGIFGWLKSGSKATVMDQAKGNIIKFKRMCIINLISSLMLLGGAILVAIFFPNINELSTVVTILSSLLYIYLMIIWIILLFYLYKTSKVLKISGNLNVRPSLILIFTIVSSYCWFILAIITFIIVWIKSNSYLKYEIVKEQII